jgi:hypothetical protein
MYRTNSPVRETGIGLRGPHYADIFAQAPAVGWMEIHPENYFGGGRNRASLLRVRADYPLSLHGVGLSLGADRSVDEDHLRRLRDLALITEPFLISDHASWSASGNAHFNDLLPLPYNEESLFRLCTNIDRVQNVLQRSILVENPSTYISFTQSTMDEAEFMNETVRRTGCGILLDINNIWVQAHNHDFDPCTYVAAINSAAVGEIHLAGHAERAFDGGTLLIDTHGHAVADTVWDLFSFALERCGPVPTLVEWDADLPPLSVLCAEADKAQTIIDTHKSRNLPHAA